MTLFAALPTVAAILIPFAFLPHFCGASTNEQYFVWGCTATDNKAQNKEQLIREYIKPNSRAEDWNCHFEVGNRDQPMPFPLPEGASAVGPKVFALMAFVLPLIFAVYFCVLPIF
ncbi:hypothetical protein niasHT_025602 [Heterodera trifolii]|uniref:Uncharacterized protein n=1 Tax=Heterodera trifolii TaxID=157864 RepID=A0ABD2KHL4_9BILA